ncbi:CPCC family cysteine-rich protein [Psychroserpens mesophilus]|uniref:CPCC family cysteine-rich protein n=1 Tax=Psychroserpens mesophilus TaxID=325473 RepID=UPI00058C82E2|nr:CPCC family cysteine-rich protein [Psychroserpens mesophilus]
MTKSNSSRKFEPNKLTESDNQIITDYRKKRTLFDNYLKENNLNLYTCPGCGYPTLTERGKYEICEVCNWEDDNQDDVNEDEVWGGPNSYLSLTENRINIGRVLNLLAENLNGKININPIQVLEIIEGHSAKMESGYMRKLMNSRISDPIWNEFRNKDKEILLKLIKQ